MAGWVRLRGALQVRPSRLGSRLLVCAFLRTRQDRGWASCPTRPRHASGPCGSRPRNRTHPAFDRFLRSVVDPRHAWMNFHRNRIFRELNEKHPRMAWIDRVDQGRHLPTAAGICRRWGGVGLQDRWRHGWRHRAPKDGFTACPAAPHRPARPSTIQSRFGSGFGSGFGFGFGPCLCRCRAQPCRNPPSGTAGQHRAAGAVVGPRRALAGKVLQPGAFGIRVTQYVLQCVNTAQVALLGAIDGLLGQPVA